MSGEPIVGSICKMFAYVERFRGRGSLATRPKVAKVYHVTIDNYIVTNNKTDVKHAKRKANKKHDSR